jgi:hypothetical protein
MMMVGNRGYGKRKEWRVIMKDIERYEGIEGVENVIDKKEI